MAKRSAARIATRRRTRNTPGPTAVLMEAADSAVRRSVCDAEVLEARLLLSAEAHYYNQGFWSGQPVASATVAQVDFHWPGGRQDVAITNSNSSSVFTGKITTDDAGVYTFVSNTAADGYLYVNGVLVSKEPGSHPEENAPAANLVPLTLAAQTDYDFVLLQTHSGSTDAGAHLEWITPAMTAASASTPVIIPASNLTALSDVPHAPTALALDPAVAANPTSYRADFTFSADNVAVVHYVLERSEDGGQTWQTVSQTDPGSATQSAGAFVPAQLKIEDASPLPGQSYAYRVRAINFDGASSASNTLSVETPIATQTPGAEARLFNGEIAANADGQDPRNALAAGIDPTEAVAESRGIHPTYLGALYFYFPNGSGDSTPSPDIPRLHPGDGAVLFTGKFVTDQAGAYTFMTNSSDDGYMYINGVLVSADPGSHAPEDPRTVVPVTLAAQTAYNFVLIQQQREQGASQMEVIEAQPPVQPGYPQATGVVQAYRPAVGGGRAYGGVEQVMDVPHRQIIDPLSGLYTTDDPTASAAANLVVTSSTGAGAVVAWVNQSPSALWFEVQRTTDDPADPQAVWQTAGRTGFGSTSFSDTGATDTTKVYAYRVRGANFDGAGPWSNVTTTANVVLPTPGVIGQACAAGTVHLLLSGQSASSGGFEIQQSQDGTNWTDAAGSPAGNSAASFDVTGLDPQQTYQFRARNLPGPGGPNASPYSGAVTVSAGGPPVVDFSQGFAGASGLELNGSANFTNSAAAPNALRLTPSQPYYQAGSAFFATRQNVAAFDTRFDFIIPQPDPPVADGFTFLLQSSPAGPAALGPNGGGLGYGPDQPYKAPAVPDSVAVKFDLSDNAGEGGNSTGLFINGDSPTVPAHSISSEASIDMTASGINLHATGHVFEVHLSYDGSTLRQIVTDMNTGAMFAHAYSVDIAAILGGPCGYVGFTGSTGAATAEQDVLSWAYTSTPDVITGAGGNDTISLRSDADGTDIDWSRNGGPLVAVAANSPDGLTIDSQGGSDTLVLDNSNGNPLPALIRLQGDFTVSGLTRLGSGQKVDVLRSTVRIDYGGTSILPAVQSWLKSGQIFSSSPLGQMAISDTDTGSAILLKPALIGDADLSGAVDFADLLRLAQNYRRSGADWSQGDSNYDGTVDFSDLMALGENYGQRSPAITATAGGIAPPPIDSASPMKGRKRPNRNLRQLAIL